MYVGRMVGIGLTPTGKLSAFYRVASRSFPNRHAQEHNCKIAILPKAGYESDILRNPYITYNCTQIVGDTAIVSNGSHTDPIAEKISSGMSVRDAFIFGLSILDYEKDAYNTARIVGAVTLGEKCGWLGIIRKDGIEVKSLELTAGICYYVATYERDTITKNNECKFIGDDADEICKDILDGAEFSQFTNPITAVCAVESDNRSFLMTLLNK